MNSYFKPMVDNEFIYRQFHTGTEENRETSLTIARIMPSIAEQRHTPLTFIEVCSFTTGIVVI